MDEIEQNDKNSSEECAEQVAEFESAEPENEVDDEVKMMPDRITGDDQNSKKSRKSKKNSVHKKLGSGTTIHQTNNKRDIKWTNSSFIISKILVRF